MPAPQTNGSARAHLTALAGVGGLTLRYDDPMTRVLELDASSSSGVRWLAYLLGAIALLLGLMVGARVASLLVAMTNVRLAPVPSVAEVDIAQDEPPPPPTPTAPQPETKPEPAPPPPPHAIVRETPPPTPPAQAGRVLTQEPDPNEPVDLTGNTIVSGNAESFPGGDTAANGTGRAPGRGGTGPSASVAAKETPPVPAGPDRSRLPSVGSTDWNAPFPPEADEAQINDADVSIQVDVRADGTAAAVRVLKDPGYGFGREARRYALSQHFQPALDRQGNPIASTFPIKVHFSR